MYDNICTLPLTSDLFAQALHPTEPIVAVGLSSGHVQVFRLPSLSSSPKTNEPNDISTTSKPNSTLPLSDQNNTRRRRSSSLTPLPPGTGTSTITSLWRTRRHKGSCRSLIFSTDGNTLFSVGTDGLLKAADTYTGRVAGKILLPWCAARNTAADQEDEDDAPAVLLALNPQVLVLGTDGGAVHLWEIGPASSVEKSNGTERQGDRESAAITQTTPVLVPSTKFPKQTFHPHHTKEDPHNDAPISSLVALSPSSASTSGVSRAFVSTAGATLAVVDVMKGVVVCSEDQGDDLTAAVCVRGGSGESSGRNGNNDGKGRKQGDSGTVLVGTSDGKVTLWERGNWSDRVGSVIVHRNAAMEALVPWSDERDIECLAIVPNSPTSENTEGHGPMVCAVGLGNGAIKFMKLGTGGKKGWKGDVVGEVKHDEVGVDGVVGLGFDVEGRMISGGGDKVIVWHRKLESEQTEPERSEEEEEEEEEEGEDEEGQADGGQVESDEEDDEAEVPKLNGILKKSKTARPRESEDEEEDEDESGSGSDSDEKPEKKRKKKRRRKGRGEKDGRSQGILAFKGLD